MTLNPFFLQGSPTEQGLVQDLINEQLRMYGVECHYIPREFVTQGTVIKEVIESRFDSAYPLEAYIENYDGYEGQGTLLSKFGITPTNELTLTISQERFHLYIGDLANLNPNRPREGDLVYFPLGDRLFEVKFIEEEDPFFQLKKTYIYKLKCELFRPQSEELNTGIAEIDDTIDNEGYTQSLVMVGLGTTAAATSITANGGVRKVTILNRGNNFVARPRVAISSAPTPANTAVGIATLIGGLVNCNGVSQGNYKVQGVEFSNTGAGYTVAPNIVFVGGEGVGVAATTTIADGVIRSITVSDGGSGYATPPVVTIAAPGGGGAQAVASAYINSSGIVTSILLRDGGSGYSGTPTITIGDPNQGNSNVGTGTYFKNETVTGNISGTTALVKTWDGTTLDVYRIDGTFVAGDVVVGAASSAEYRIKSYNIDDIVDPYADNDTIETEADAILDFSETNPFGTP